jgi:hypothetical protein
MALGPAALPADAGARSTVITVLAGKPTEFAFTLSRFSKLPPGSLVFRIRNAGSSNHDFVLCENPVRNASRNSCIGYQSRDLDPGQTTTITLSSIAKGVYEFLSADSGDAQSGMKGLIGVGVAVKEPHFETAPLPAIVTTAAGTPPAATATPSTPDQTTTPSGGGGYICKRNGLIQGVTTAALCQGTQGDTGSG